MKVDNSQQKQGDENTNEETFNTIVKDDIMDVDNTQQPTIKCEEITTTDHTSNTIVNDDEMDVDSKQQQTTTKSKETNTDHTSNTIIVKKEDIDVTKINIIKEDTNDDCNNTITTTTTTTTTTTPDNVVQFSEKEK